MKVKFLGTPECEKEITIRQLKFIKDKVYVIHDVSLAKKLGNLPYFEEVEGDAKAEAPKDDPAKPDLKNEAGEAKAEAVEAEEADA